MSVQKQNSGEQFEEIRVVESGELLIYIDGIGSNMTVINDEKGTTYNIDLDDQSCSCKGYKFRSECKHIDGLEQVDSFLDQF